MLRRPQPACPTCDSGRATSAFPLPNLQGAAEEIGAAHAREQLGANATGLPFNSIAAIERTVDGRTNPIVNAGALATTSLVPGGTSEDKWRFIRTGLSKFAARTLALNEEVYASASETNSRNQGIARCCRATAASTPSLPRPRSSIPGSAR